ncbi:NADP-dependent oxidoreductase domain-containing protein [Crepidotus variabilis]|uniref:NADP-dependent oxidoreductase domain-containing protein n=1 Tax=Crepidotus variabilis TaxID=179855 RepID=A0A9P6JP73_9AGAR|nr:NADP-dependent oxidoreductase domain-containing protein [Crepidotus variabilis]
MPYRGDVKVKLNNGIEIPIVGTGAFDFPDKYPTTKGWLSSALKNGYRHIDTARMYGTEKFVGEVIRESGIPREQIFVTTKLSPLDHGRVQAAFQESLDDLGLEYVDLYLIHWPQTWASNTDGSGKAAKNPNGSNKTLDTPNFVEAWVEVEKILASGKTKSIGVSNFSVKTLEVLLKTAKVVPAINQIELHPYLAQNDLRDYCNRKGIVLTAYTPSGYDKVRNDPLINELANKYNATANQITLAWHLSRNTVIVPKSSDNGRQKENINLPEVSEEDLAKIWHLDRGERQCNKANPTHHTVWGWTYEQLGWEDYHAPVREETSKL